MITWTVLIIGWFIWWLGARITSQVKDLQWQIPQLTSSVTWTLSESPAWRRVLQQGEKFQIQSQSGESGQQSLSAVTSFFSSTFGALGDLYIIFIISIYFTASPLFYKKTILKIVPQSHRDKRSKLLTDSYETLWKRIQGQIAAMLIVFGATSIGLSIMWVPYALVFGLLAWLLNFIPNFWPLIAMIPTALVALTVSPQLALWVIILYVVIQNIEGEFVTPLIQQRMVKLAPAAIIIFQVFMWIIAWGIWVVLATPLLAVLTVWIHKLYIKPIADKS